MAKMVIGLSGVAEAVGKLRRVKVAWSASRKPQLDRIAARFAERVRKNLQSSPPPPLSEVTLKMRKGGGGSALIDSGDLLASVKPFAGDREASVVADKFYASFQQFGFTTGEKSAIPGKKVPARPFVLLDQGDIDWALELLRDQMLGEDAGEKAA